VKNNRSREAGSTGGDEFGDRISFVRAILVIAPGMANTIHGAEYKIRSYAPKWIRSQGEHEARLKGGD
jgi:hypothetical protein